MAEGLFKEYLKELKNENAFTITTSSAGLHALVDYPPAYEAQETMLNIGIDISHHRARQLSNEMILSSDLVLVMDKLQKREIERMSPIAYGKVHLIGKWSDFEVPDPYNQSLRDFRYCLELLERGWQDWKSRLIA
jgi:protein-tyrosine phosphatase